MKESTIGAVGSRRASGDGLGSLLEVCAGDKAAFGDNWVTGLSAKTLVHSALPRASS